MMNIIGKKFSLKNGMWKITYYTALGQDGKYVAAEESTGAMKKLAYEVIIMSAAFPDADAAFLAELEAEKQMIAETRRHNLQELADRHAPANNDSAGRNGGQLHRTRNHQGDTLYILMTAFSGEYIKGNSGKNIGHECINFYQPENKNRFYLYLNDNGRIPEQYAAYDGNITLLTVANVPNQPYKYEILSRAEHCHILPEDEAKFPGAVYGSKRVEDVYLGNLYNGESDPVEAVRATFWAEPADLYVPEHETICLIHDEAKADIRKNISHGMHFYLDDVAVPDAERYLSSISWKGFDGTAKCLPGYPKTPAAYTGTSAKDKELHKFALAAGM